MSKGEMGTDSGTLLENIVKSATVKCKNTRRRRGITR
jgi:hypothetical protein